MIEERLYAMISAAKAMVVAHSRHETMVPAVEEVQEQFPDISTGHLIACWMGVNAKSREGLDPTKGGTL